MSLRRRTAALTEAPWRRAGPLACVMVAGLLLALLAALTPPSELNGGVGNDGVWYARMVTDLQDGVRVPVKSLAAYRLLPVGIVAASRLDPRDGFLLLDVAALLGSALLLLAHLNDVRVPRAVGLVGVGWWLLIPFGARMNLHDPVSPEALGTFFFLALTLLARRGHALWFAVVMSLAVLTRENLIALIPFLMLAERSRAGARRAIIGGSLATVTGFAALISARLWGPIPADPVIPLVGAALLNSFVTLLNVNDHAVRLLAGTLLDFGVIPAVLAAAPLATVTFFRRTPGWVYVGVVTVALAVIGGVDHDRYLAALGVPMTLAACVRLRSMGWGSIALLTVLHIGAVRVLWPIGVDEAGSLAHVPSTMTMERLAVVALWTLAFMAAAYVLARRANGTGPGASTSIHDAHGGDVVSRAVR